jgi:hypothetical protein
MAQKTDAELLTEAGIIKNEIIEYANSANRVGTMLQNIIDSKPNNTQAGVTTGVINMVSGEYFVLSGGRYNVQGGSLGTTLSFPDPSLSAGQSIVINSVGGSPINVGQNRPMNAGGNTYSDLLAYTTYIFYSVNNSWLGGKLTY